MSAKNGTLEFSWVSRRDRVGLSTCLDLHTRYSSIDPLVRKLKSDVGLASLLWRSEKGVDLSHVPIGSERLCYTIFIFLVSRLLFFKSVVSREGPTLLYSYCAKVSSNSRVLIYGGSQY